MTRLWRRSASDEANEMRLPPRIRPGGHGHAAASPPMTRLRRGQFDACAANSTMYPRRFIDRRVKTHLPDPNPDSFLSFKTRKPESSTSDAS
jgi:hypothetical protein